MKKINYILELIFEKIVELEIRIGNFLHPKTIEYYIRNYKPDAFDIAENKRYMKYPKKALWVDKYGHTLDHPVLGLLTILETEEKTEFRRYYFFKSEEEMKAKYANDDDVFFIDFKGITRNKHIELGYNEMFYKNRHYDTFIAFLLDKDEVNQENLPHNL